jgi:protein-S-isoprenylcysteine O-methyltransferase Ste14
MLYWWIGFVVLFACRVWLCIQLLSTHQVEAVGLVLIESASILLGCANAVVADRRDDRLVGLAVPAAYAAGIWLLPPSGSLLIGTRWTVFVVAVGLSAWGLVSLRERFSIAASSWVSLCDWGPYRWIRHPQLAGRLLIVTAVAMSGVDTVDLLRLAGCVVLTLTVIEIEESMLRSIDAWREYSRRVRWQLCPGVL